MHNGSLFFRSEDKFEITGEQISILSYLARQQCGSKSNTDKMLAILRKVLEQETRQSKIDKAMADLPSPGCGQANYLGFSQGDPIEKLR